MNLKPKQFDFDWNSPEPFALVTEQTTDGERIQREHQQRESDRSEAEKKQSDLL